MTYAARRSKRLTDLAAAVPIRTSGGRYLYVPAAEVRIGDRTFDPDGAYQVSAIRRLVHLRESILIVTELTEFIRPAAARVPVWRTGE